MIIKNYEQKSIFAGLNTKLLMISLVFTQLVIAMNPQERAAAPDEEQNIARQLNAPNVDAWDLVKMFKIDSKVGSLVLTNDNKYLFLGMKDSIIQMWDIATSKLIKIFKGHQNAVHALALTHDEKFLVSTSGDNTIKVWDIETGKCKTDIKAASEPYYLSDQIIISKDNRDIFSVKKIIDFNDYKKYGDIIDKWDLQTGKKKLSSKYKNYRVESIYLTENEQNLIIGSYDIIIILNLINSEFREIAIREKKIDLGEVLHIKDTERSIFYVHAGSLFIFDKTNETKKDFALYQTDHDNHEPLSVSKDNKCVVARAIDLTEDETDYLVENKINIWDIEAGRCIYKIISQDKYCVDELLISNDKNLIIAACNDGIVRIFRQKNINQPVADKAAMAGSSSAAASAASSSASTAEEMKENISLTCAVCNSNNNIRRCGGCQNVYYCSNECQSADRPAHKAQCKK